MQEKIVGILGGVGPYAGLDLVKKIHDNTIAFCDHDHLNIILYSLPSYIPDRSEFLLKISDNNPGIHIGKLFISLAKAGAEIIVMPCNTAHSEKILNKALNYLFNQFPYVRFLNMIDILSDYIKSNFKKKTKIGILATKGTIVSKLYENILIKNEICPIIPNEDDINLLHDAIYNRKYGIKSLSNPVNSKAINIIYQVMNNLIKSGSDSLLLACTELPLAICSNNFINTPILDCNRIFAREIIKEVNPHKLKP